MIEDLTGIVLAGGLSSRFGGDKASAPWGDGTLLEAVVGNVLLAVPRALVAAKPEQARLLADPRVTLLPDAFASRHPLVGLYTGLAACPTAWAFVVACDMPFVRPALIGHLARQRGDGEAVLPIRNKRPQFLCGLYSRKCLPELRLFLTLYPDKPILEFVKRLRVTWVTGPDLAPHEPDGLSFFDIDDRPAYATAQRLAEEAA